MRKLTSSPEKGTRQHRKMLSTLADSIKQPGMRMSLMSAEKRRQVIMDAKAAAIEQRIGKHAARLHVKDGWGNFLTGLGMPGRDKRTANYAGWGLTLQENVAEDIYAADSLARRIVEILPNDATREWIEPDKEADLDGLDEEHDRLQVRPRIEEAWQWARLYGGGAIFVNDGSPIETLHLPLRPDGLDKIVGLTTLTRWELWAWATDIQRDISKADFGLPERYHIYPRMAFGQQAFTVHASRIIRFDGRRLPKLLFIRNNFWGDSVLTPIYDALGDYAVTHHALANILQSFAHLTHGITGLSNKVAAGGEADLVRQMEIMNMVKSVMGTLIYDKELDEVDMLGTPLSGVDQLVDKITAMLQAKTDIPHSILFNEAPGGQRSMGSSGDHEQNNWFNTVASWQETYERPRLDQINKLIFAQRRGPFKGKKPKNPKYTFKPLEQLNDKEVAEARLANAQADDLEIQNGIRTNVQVQAQRYPELAEDEPAQLQLNLNQQALQTGNDPNDRPTPTPGTPGSVQPEPPNADNRK